MPAIIPGVQKLEAIFGRVTYSPLSKVYLLNFFFDTRLQRPGYSMLLALDTDRPCANFRITFLFSGVKSLKMQDFGNWPTQITGFDITDVRDHQLEGINFEVTDYENGIIEFWCATAEILEITEIADV